MQINNFKVTFIQVFKKGADFEEKSEIGKLQKNGTPWVIFQEMDITIIRFCDSKEEDMLQFETEFGIWKCLGLERVV